MMDFNIYGNVGIKYIIKYVPLSSTLCLNLIIPNTTPRGLFSGGLIHGRSFPFQKLVPKRPGVYTRWGLLSEFYCMFIGHLAQHEIVDTGVRYRDLFLSHQFL